MLMQFDIYTLLFVLVLWLTIWHGGRLVKNKKKAHVVPTTKVEAKPVRSAASDAILAIFDEIPVESRNASRSELEASLDALDFKHGIDKVHDHFSCHGTRWVSFIRCSCVGTVRYNHGNLPCKMPEYAELNKSLNGIGYAVKNREKALVEARHQAELAGRQIDLDRIADLTERFRNEAKIISEVSKELL